MRDLLTGSHALRRHCDYSGMSSVPSRSPELPIAYQTSEQIYGPTPLDIEFVDLAIVSPDSTKECFNEGGSRVGWDTNRPNPTTY